MFKRSGLLCLLLSFAVIANSQSLTTTFEKSNGKETPTYAEIISWWKNLDARSGKVFLQEMDMTDAGFPLHLVFVSNNSDHNIANIKKNNKRIILINNGIHPGEPDGIDASMLLARDIVAGKYSLPDNIVLAIIPVYNIGGCLNRSADFRVDQNGPEEFGSRGNSQNLDLNRDFIKCDSKDARAFTKIFHLLDPDVFVDNHVSNGADYQHVMTLLTTQHNKLGGVMGDFLEQNFEPALYARMKTKGYDLVPYVNHFGDTPEKGWTEFWDSPRYGSGYGALWNTFSFVPETHMLKPYDQRVRATYVLMQTFIEYTSVNSQRIHDVRKQQKENVKEAASFAIGWTVDKTKFKEVLYKGYESGHRPSEVSGLPRLFYDRNKPYEKNIRILNHYVAATKINLPSAYIIPQGWWKVIGLLQLNQIKMQPLNRDTIIEVEVYHIEDYKPLPRQYEGHHPNGSVKLTTTVEKIEFRKGDWLIKMNQEGNRFLFETLEPQAEDSYFVWNFFDSILGQKEGYSDYSFEDIAAKYLAGDAALQRSLMEKRNSDTAFAKNADAQLNFVFQHSKWYEPAHMRYPVFRLMKAAR